MGVDDVGAAAVEIARFRVDFLPPVLESDSVKAVVPGHEQCGDRCSSAARRGSNAAADQAADDAG